MTEKIFRWRWLVLGCVLCGGGVRAEVVVYPAPPGLAEGQQGRASRAWEVKVTQNGKTSDSFVYEIPADKKIDTRHNVCSFTTFSFAGAAAVTVKRRGGEPVRSAGVYPLSYGIKPEIIGPDTVRFGLDRPGRKMAVIINDDWDAHPLLVFGDELEKDVPRQGEPNVVYFGPGVHEAGQIRLESGQTLYLAGGAYVKGWVKENDLRDVRVGGRGILSAESRPGGRGGVNKQTMAFDGNGANIVVEGLTFIQQQGFACTVRGEGHVVRGVKIIGNWHPTTDGVVVGNGGLVEDCFIKADDDSIKLYGSNVTVRRCVIWQMENGGVLQHGWTRQNAAGNHVYDMDIIRTEWTTTGRDARGVISSVGLNGSGGNHVFEDIRVDGGGGRIISMNTKRGSNATWSNVVIRNLTVNNWNPVEGQISGSGIQGITFENFKLNGQYVTDPNQANLKILNGASDIRFVVTRSRER